jgi:CBS domain containing-hemolysin-like protein
LGITVTSFGDWIGGGAVDRQLLRAPLDALRLDADVTDVAAFALALLLATAVQMVYGELVPKNIALSRPAGSVVWVVLPLLVFDRGAQWPGEPANCAWSGWLAPPTSWHR